VLRWSRAVLAAVLSLAANAGARAVVDRLRPAPEEEPPSTVTSAC
jgi:hypothetical protein